MTDTQNLATLAAQVAVLSTQCEALLRENAQLRAREICFHHHPERPRLSQFQ
jgi:hypothetical protein